MKTGFKPHIILDTNVIVSGILFQASIPRDVLTQALNDYSVTFSEQTWDELSLVLQRPKFDRHFSLERRLLALTNLASKIAIIGSKTTVTDCRDPKDNKFLALAIDAGAKIIVTGDKDLLVMHPYKDITICTPAEFLSRHTADL
jgi:putative PIN family toxin of toxin-antitoxin system